MIAINQSRLSATPRHSPTLGILCLLGLLSGCGPQEQIQRYKAPRTAEPVRREPETSAPARPADAAESALKYDAPKSWTAGKSGGLRKAAFEVQADDKRVEITVIDLAEAAGDVLPNVNRWRGQVKLDDTTAAELKKDAKTIQVSGVEGTYVELIGPETASPRQTILGVIAIHGSKAWFVKLQGDSELAAREKGRFEEFVKSVKF